MLLWIGNVIKETKWTYLDDSVKQFRVWTFIAFEVSKDGSVPQCDKVTKGSLG